MYSLYTHIKRNIQSFFSNTYNVEQNELALDHTKKKRILEFSYGILKSDRIKSKNILSSRSYTNLTFLPFILLKFLNKSGILINFILLIYETQINDQFPIVFITYFLFFFLKEFYYESENIRFDKSKNKKTCLKIEFGTKKLNSQVVHWGDVQIGDFILLKRNEISPADILICDIKDRICQVTTSFVDGKGGYSIKLPLLQTSFSNNPNLKKNLENYKKILSGKIVINSSSTRIKCKNDVNGFIKLEKDPKIEYFSEKNIIFRESQLKITEWLLGIVLFVGEETLISSKKKLSLKQGGYFEDQISRLILIIFLFILLLSGFCEISYLYSQTEFIKTSIFINSLLYSANLISVVYYFVIDVITLIEKMKLEQYYRKEGNYSLKIKNPDSLTNLKQIGSVIIDKNQTIMGSEIIITGLITIKDLYFIEERDLAAIRDFMSHSKREIIVNNKDHIDFEILDKSKTDVISIPDELCDAAQKIENTKIQIVDENSNPKNQTIVLDYNTVNQINQIKFEPINKQDSIKSTKINSIFIDLSEKQDKDQVKKSKSIAFLMNESMIPDDFSPTTKKLKNSRFIGKSTTRNKEYETDYQKSFKSIINDSNDLSNIFKTFLLCHISKTKYLPKTNSFIQENLLPETESILDFCEKCGCKFISAYKMSGNKYLIYEISINKEKSEFYPILAINEETQNRHRFSILIGNDLNDLEKGSTLYIRGRNPSEMLEILNINEFDKLNIIEKIDKHTEKGLTCIIYASKKLDFNETKIYLKRNKTIKTSLTINVEELETLYNSIEQKVDFVSVLCIKESLKNDVETTIQMMKEASMKIFFVSNDDETSTLINLFQCGLLKSNKNLYKINVDNDNNALISLKYLLQKLQRTKNIQEEPHSRLSDYDFSPKRISFSHKSLRRSDQEIEELTILIKGSSFTIIYKNKYLRQHLLFLMMFCKIALFECTRLEKKRLAKMIKDIENAWNRNLMVIGDGFDDYDMMKESDVSIEINKHTILYQGDIIIDDFKKIKELIFDRSAYLFEKIEKMLAYLINCFLNIYFSQFFYQFFNQFSFVEIISNDDFIIMDVIIVLNTIFSYFLVENNVKNKLKMYYPVLYKLDMRANKVEIPRILLTILFPSLASSSLMLYFSIFSLNYFNGGLNSFMNTSFLLNITLFFSFYSKLYLLVKNFKLASILGIIVFSVTSYWYISLKRFDYYNIFVETFSNFQSFAYFLFCIVSTLISDYFFMRIFDFNYDFIEKIHKILIQKSEITFSNVVPLNMQDQKNLLKSLTSSIFNSQKSFKQIKNLFEISKMDPIVLEIISPSNDNHNEIAVNKWTLRFKEIIFQKKFKEFENKMSVFRNKMNLFILISLIGNICYDIIMKKDYKDIQGTIILAQIAISLLFFFIFCLIKRSIKSNFSSFFSIFALVLYFVIYLSFTEKEINKLDGIYYQIIAILFFLLLQLDSLTTYTISISFLMFGLLIITIINFTTISDVTNFNMFWKIYLAFFLLENLISMIIQKYLLESKKIEIFLSEENLKIEKKKINDILSLLVPKFIKDLMYQGNFVVSEDQNNVIVLFADIVDFEKITAEEDQNLVTLLDSIYRIFDQLCLKNNVQKIETVGKTYMACAGLKECELDCRIDTSYTRNCADRVISLAIEMLKYASHHTWGQKGNPIKLKIGIHNGPVIAGIIGFHKPQFSLIGDTVNTSSRVCATSEYNRVTISESVYNIINKNKEYVYNERKVQAKGKGELLTYQVISAREFKKNKNENNTNNTINNIDDNFKKEKEQGLLRDFEKRSNIKRKTQMKRLNNIIITKKNDESPNFILNLQKIPENSAIDITKNFVKAKSFRKSSRIPSIDPQMPAKKNSNSFEIKESPQTVKKQLKSNTSNEKLSSSVLIGDDYHHKIVIFGKENVDQYYEILDENPINKLLEQTNTGYYKKNSTIGGNKRISSKSLNKYLSLNDDYIENISPNNVMFVDQFLLKANKFSLLFTNQDKETINEYYKEQKEINQEQERINFLLYLGFNFFTTFFWFVIHQSILNLTAFIVLRISISSLGVFYLYSRYYKLFIDKFYIITSIFYVFFLIILILFQYYNTWMNIVSEIELLLLYLSFSRFNFLNFVGKILIGFLTLIGIEILNYLKDCENYFVLWSCSCIIFFNCLIFYFKIIDSITNFNNSRVNEIKKKQLNNLVSHLLPVHILEKFVEKNDVVLPNDYFHDVTILFADIVNFTKYSSNVTPIEVVNMLRELFTEFDKLTLQLNVFKIYTIGDCYVIIGLVNSNERDPYIEARNTVLMGFAMIDCIKEMNLKEKSYAELNMRIGIHTGTIIGGIVGTDIVRYDIYGKDVYIANKMESNGSAGRVNISENTYNMLIKNKREEEFEFEEYKQIDIPGTEGSLKSYLVNLKNFDSSVVF